MVSEVALMEVPGGLAVSFSHDLMSTFLGEIVACGEGKPSSIPAVAHVCGSILLSLCAVPSRIDMVRKEID